jgi:protein TonB
VTIRRNRDLRTGYAIRSQACLAAALLLAVAAVRLWPAHEAGSEEPAAYRSFGQETIEIEEIVQTRQRKEKPPPPPPSLQVVVADDEVIDDYELDLPEDFLAYSENDGEAQDGGAGPPAAGMPPDLIEPRPVRIVEPEYTKEAQRRKVRAEIVVEVLVDERGQVSKARVLEMFLLGKDEERELVSQLGYGLEESALAAAERCMFRPARFGGKTVSGYKTLRFSFGV